MRASANMPMPGMVMSGGLEVHRTIALAATKRLPNSAWPGAWHMAIEWDGPAGRGSVNFEGAVQ